jgi:glutamate synthase (NADPH/NADH) large chain
MNNGHNSKNTMYSPTFERDNCGFGLIANMDDKPSSWIIDTSIEALNRLKHRGAVSDDGKSSDGCGLLIKKPNEFLHFCAEEIGIELRNNYAFGTIFMPRNKTKHKKIKETFFFQIKKLGMEVLGWRNVPINKKVCGDDALKSLPDIQQIIISGSDDLHENEFEKKLYVARLQVEKILNDPDLYVCSMSSKVISYKGLIVSENIQKFYPDLVHPKMKTSLCVFHQRFSTNTLPQWKLAQPFRHLAHNGEINTIQGNRHWYMARRNKLDIKDLPELNDMHPVVSMSDSDSYSLDNMLEYLLAGDMGIFRAMRTLVPPAWQNNNKIDKKLKACFEYHSMHMEPWDGPAGIVLTDGRYAACVLDRNGLRPARYIITKDRHITLASEVGVYDYDDSDVLQKGRLAPGDMLAVDTLNGEVLLSDDINKILKDRHPYDEWLNKNSLDIGGYELKKEKPLKYSNEELIAYKKFYGVSLEEEVDVILPLAKLAVEGTGSMGDDTPMPVLSKQSRSLYDYFRQQFAQVTNPPIDSLRETSVMSLETCLGVERNLFEESSLHAGRLVLDSPVLSNQVFEKIVNYRKKGFPSDTLSLHYDNNIDLEEAINTICDRAVRSVKKKNVLIVLSDQKLNKDQLTIPAAMAVGAVHHRLITEGLRCDCNIIVETASAWNSHHFAVLLGYGASAIYPYLAFNIINDLLMRNSIDKNSYPSHVQNFIKGINKGLLKIMSKMGISCISSYRGAQLFETIGINSDVIDLCFRNNISRIEGVGFEDIERDLEKNKAYSLKISEGINKGGLLKFTAGGEYHDYNPDVVKSLQACVTSGEYEDYKKFASLVNSRDPSFLRDLFNLKNKKPIALEQVESSKKILKRFDTAGMSLGALSPEAHEALAIAMNTIGGRSNSGEGGEDIKRYNSPKTSKIKQVASGRFGVTPHYLVNADVIQIKIAQGAKPGEGGQLPGDKVDQYIAKLRYSVPGVTLISPPPHHDIYSIEDLAQLIYDLKQVNNKALISVKLVSQKGVGTIAAGVTKAYADLITISGYDGGTGASPLTSVKYAGAPWEMGIAETQQTLMLNKLRQKVRIQTDGGLKTGLDVIKAAIFGAESYGFGTSVMVALGCKYLRICHLNNCATGVATQNKLLRMKHFSGSPERVVNYFKFIAQDVREIMASIGVKSIDELIGQTQYLSISKGITQKQKSLSLKKMLTISDKKSPKYCNVKSNKPYDKGILAKRILRDSKDAILNRMSKTLNYDIKNLDRSIGASLSGEIAKLYGNHGFSKTPIILNLTGTAGQSLGVWNAGGVDIYLTGDANDYVGKGMSGGKIIIKTTKHFKKVADKNSIIGNTCLYGATGGKMYAEGKAGERFAVRNSGAVAVVEGAGDHCCEYMTGGCSIILGEVGNNFGAGMTGGVAFMYDKNKTLHKNINDSSVEYVDLSSADKITLKYFKTIMKDYINETNSINAKEIMKNLNDEIKNFKLIKPINASMEDIIKNTINKVA